MKKLIIILAAVFGLGLFGWFFTTSDITVESSAQHEFTINESMPRVRKIIVRTNAVKKIVAMADAKLLDQKWLDMNFDAGGKILDRDWNVDGSGQLEVVVENAYLGDVNLTLDQNVDIRRDRLESVSKLAKSSGAITKYDSSIELTPDSDGKAKFQTALSLEISTKANFFTRSIVEKNIKAAADNALKDQEEAFRQIVDDKKGELLILPDEMSK